MTQQFSDNLTYGNDFEMRFSEHLIQKGFYIIPYFKYNNNGAPLLYGLDREYVLPDILAFGKKNMWIECKRKKRMSNGMTGYKLRSHEDYKAIKELSGIDVFIVFEDNDQWYGNFIEELESNPLTQKFMVQGKENIMFHYPEAFVKIIK